MPVRKRRSTVRKTSTTKRSKKLAPRQRSRKPVSVSSLRKMIRSIRWTESYTSLLMGVIAVVVGVLFVLSFLKQTHHVQQTSSTSTVAVTSAPTTTPSTGSGSLTPTPSEFKPGQKTYTVKPGDDLWHIAETFYKSGYNWVDIAKANNLANPGVIHAGNTLIIPNVESKVATVTPTSQPPQINTITGTTYTVQKGDDLWHIAVRAYADGYQWTKIAQANNLSNPSLIFSGNVLKIPR